MTFDAKQFEEFIDDEYTVINLQTNDAGNGEYVITMSAYIRPQSPLREKYLNPSRNMGRIPVEYARACPRCDSEWEPLTYDIKDGQMKTTVYHCCGMAIDSTTYKKFARGDKVDIQPAQTNTMARATESQNNDDMFIDFGNNDDMVIEFGGDE